MMLLGDAHGAGARDVPLLAVGGSSRRIQVFGKAGFVPRCGILAQDAFAHGAVNVGIQTRQ